MRPLLVVVGAVVFLDMLFYTALAPLLPTYAEQLDMSKAQSGVLHGSYAAGVLAFALPCGWLAARIGVRRTTICGLALLGVSSLMFGFARSIVVLDLARVLQGAGAACSWSGALAWLVAAAPSQRRGALVGATLGVSLVGALAGPALGAVAELAGPQPFFATIAATALAVACVALRIAAPSMEPVPGPRALIGSLVGGGYATPIALLALFGVAGAVIGTLVPLRLDALGAGAGAIAATFLTAAAVEAWVNPLTGRWGDRAGDRLAPVRIALPVAAAGFVLLAATGHRAAVAILAVVTLGAVGVIFTPVATFLGDRAEADGLPLPMAYALLNLGWAAGSVLGSSGGAALAGHAGDPVVYCVAALLCVVAAGGCAGCSPRHASELAPATPSLPD